MKTVSLPGIEQPVSEICLGTAYLGYREDEKTSFAILDAYYAAGGRFLNTAHEYGDGLSETTVGKWIRERGVRAEMTVTSKCGEDQQKPKSLAMHAEELLEDLDQSLSRAGFDYFDFYLLHVDDETVPVGEIVDAMYEMKRAGKIRYYGCSNWSIERQEEAAAWADSRGIPRFAVDEIEMNLATPNVRNREYNCKWLDGEYAAYHRSTGMPVGAYSPIANGILTKYLRDGDTRAWNAHQNRMYTNERTFEAARRVGRVAEETGYTPTQVQMAWILSQPLGFPCFPIVGARTPEQLADSLGSVSCELTPDMIRYLRG